MPFPSPITYDYSATLNNKVAAGSLHEEIADSQPPEQITTALDYVNTDDATTTISIFFKADLPDAEKPYLDNIVAAHAGDLPSTAPVNAEGAPYVQALPGKQGRKMIISGRKFDIAAGATVDDDATYAEVRELQGAQFEISAAEPGDYVELYLVDDATPTPNVLGQFGEKVYVPPSGRGDQIVSEGTVSFPAGWGLRTRYVATTAGVTRTAYVYFRMRK